MNIEEGISELKLETFFRNTDQHKMAILILDELDMIAGTITSKKSGLDKRISSLLASLIDKMGSNVYIIGLSNRLHAIDPSFLRSGRIDDIMEIVIKLPEQRYAILQIVTKRSLKKISIMK